MSYEESVNSYIKLYVKCEEICHVGEKHNKIIDNLPLEKENSLSTISCLQNEITLLTFKLDNMTNSVRMLNNDSNMLDEILQVGKGSGNLKGIGFNYQSLKKQGTTSVTKFVLTESKFEFAMSDQMSRHLVQHLKPQAKSKFLSWKYVNTVGGMITYNTTDFYGLLG